MSSKFEIKFEVSPSHMAVMIYNQKGKAIYLVKPTTRSKEFRIIRWDSRFEDNPQSIVNHFDDYNDFGEFVAFVEGLQGGRENFHYSVSLEGVELELAYFRDNPTSDSWLQNGLIEITHMSVYAHGVWLPPALTSSVQGK